MASHITVIGSPRGSCNPGSRDALSSEIAVGLAIFVVETSLLVFHSSSFSLLLGLNDYKVQTSI